MSNILGQYFTTNKILQRKVYKYILNNPTRILEPSCGKGHLVQYIKNKIDVRFNLYEIDQSLILLDLPDNNYTIRYCDFITKKITRTYDTIIGNPPYVKFEGTNLYILFIEKCFNLLRTNGELIFIIPSDFFKLTSASDLLQKMYISGTFTHIYHPHNEKLFTGASIDIIIFRYCKNNTLDKKCIYDDTKSKEERHIINNSGIITFSKSRSTGHILGDMFHIYVGLVSGCESVFKNDKYGNIEVLNKKDTIDKYIFVDEYPTDDKQLDKYLYKYKDTLMNRRIRTFNENNWYEWGAPRNIKHIKSNLGNECIYVSTITRKDTIAFTSIVQYFGGGLIMLIPKNVDICCNDVCKYLNTKEFKDNYI